jgi:hypothetical protein
MGAGLCLLAGERDDIALTKRASADLILEIFVTMLSGDRQPCADEAGEPHPDAADENAAHEDAEG